MDMAKISNKYVKHPIWLGVCVCAQANSKVPLSSSNFLTGNYLRWIVSTRPIIRIFQTALKSAARVPLHLNPPITPPDLPSHPAVPDSSQDSDSLPEDARDTRTERRIVCPFWIPRVNSEYSAGQKCTRANAHALEVG